MIDPTTTDMPLTEAQRGMWYAQRIDPGNPVFNTGQYFDLLGTLDERALVSAIDTAMQEADALAVRLSDTADGPRQIVDESRRATVRLMDFRGDPDGGERARAWMQREMATPIDLERDAVTAQALIRVADDRWFWYQRVHHIAIDGYGTALLTDRVCDLYATAVSGSEPMTTPFAPYAPVVAASLDYEGSGTRATDRAFWLAEFADRPQVASLAEQPAITANHYLTASVEVPTGFDEALVACAARAKAPWPDVLVALIGAYLHRFTGQGEVVVGVPSMERLGTVAARVPAMTMNVLPVRLPVDEDAPLEQFLADSARRIRAARRHGRYRGEQIRRDLGLLGEGRRLHGPLINILPFDRAATWPHLQSSLHVLGTGPVDDLTVSARSDGRGAHLRLELDGNPALYDLAELQTHGQRLAVFLDQAVRASALSAVQTVTPKEWQRWVVDVNDTVHEVEDTTLAALIDRTMRRLPLAPAVISGEETWTYRELDERSSALAASLLQRGVRRGDIVAVTIPRSVDLVLALVAIVRAGAAYLPIDPGYPKDRIAVTLDLAQPRLVLTVRSTAALVPPAMTQLRVDEDSSFCGVRHDTLDAYDAPQPDDAAYVIYTSGSTGAPKGVVNEHRGIVNRLEWMRTQYGVSDTDRILQKTPATFDVSVWEFFLPALTGAALVVAPADAHKDPAWLASVVRSHAITTMHFVPSMLSVFLDEPAAAGLRLTRVFCSGEELPAALRDRFHTVIQSELHNLYGPTEAAVDVTYWDCGPDDRSAPIPIGRPVWNTQMYVLDARRRPLPPGVAGDLYIGGIQVARGYLGRPDLTAERFIPNPFAPGRMYKTGDLARWRQDGAIVYLGRSDFQVKIRGLRIELGEIETSLLAIPAIAQAVVVARQDRPGDHRLVAYVVPRDRSDASVDHWRAHLTAQLPDYMVPAAFVVLDELPLSSNGKLDRKALPAPTLRTTTRARGAATPTEQRLATIFSVVLDVGGPMDVDADFFSMGGHSLLAAQAMQRVRDEWRCEMNLGELFAAPSVARLAARIDMARAVARPHVDCPDDAGLAQLVIVAGHDAPAREPLFCVHPAGGLSWCYATLGRAIEPARRVVGIQTRGVNPDAELPASLEGMAREYVSVMRTMQPRGPYHLAGWSVGGIIAQAMAVELQDANEQLATLAVLDAYPSDRWRDEAEPDEGVALRALLLIAGHDPDALAAGVDGDAPLTREIVVDFLRRSGHPLAALPARVLEGIVRTVAHNSQLVRRHRHRKYDGRMLFFRAGLDHVGLDLSPEEWRPHVGTLEVHIVPSLHAHMTGPIASAHIARVLNEGRR